jgi:midasin (ATPase involved in ribosome maturation)
MVILYVVFNFVFLFVISAKFPILIRGRHGIGKFTIVYQIAEQMGLPVIERRASQMTEGDLLGLPKVEGNVTQWLAPEWLHNACNQASILFLDEVDRATMEVRQGIFELCDSRKIAGYSLHPDTVIFVCVNGGGDHGDQYQVGEMDPAELDRYTVFDVKPTVEDWLSWADGNVNQVIWDFINDQHNHLEHNDDYEPNKVYPSRRSWERLSRTLGDQDLKALANTGILYHLTTGFVGFEAAVALVDYVKNYNKIVTVEDILEGKHKLTKDFKINDHNALIERFKQSKVFDRDLTNDEVVNVAEYFVTLPSELGMLFFQVLSQGKSVQKNAHAIHTATLSDGSTPKDYLMKILAQN